MFGEWRPIETYDYPKMIIHLVTTNKFWFLMENTSI